MTGTDTMADRVLVLGGGLAGVACARKLGDEGIDVVLVDRNDYHQFQPLLYQVASSQLPAEDIARPHRAIFADYPSVSVVTAEASRAGLADRSVVLSDGRTLTGSHLVLAAGARPNFFGVPGAAEHAFPLYSVADAERLRLHLQRLLREAMEGGGSAEPGALDVVVVGGGPTGVETTGALAELMRALRRTGRLDPAGRVTVVDRSPVLLGQFSRKAHDYALRKLTEVGVQVKLETGVTAVHPDRVEFDDATTIAARTVVWGGGESGAAVAQTLGSVLGRGGRLDVRRDLTVEGHPGVYAVGDVANIPSPAEGAPALPQLGSVAQQSGRWAAENILRELRHQPVKPFRYKDKGIMAMIGRDAAVAEVGKHRHQVEGPLAFAAWLGVHAMLISGVHSRTDAFLAWAWDYFERDHSATVEASSAPRRIAWGGDDRDVPHISLDRPEPADTPARRENAAGPARQAHTDSREMDVTDRHYDVIIIGTGAGGGTLAHRLAPSGKQVLLLERGGYLPRERDNWDSTAVFVKGKYRAPEFWYDAHGAEFPPEVNYYVGGNTKFYGAALFRLRPQDFGELRHHGGISPAWPIGYQDLEPYYTQAEQLYLVHGHHGEDPTEGPVSGQYSYPPVQHEPRIQQLSDDLEKQGLHPFHLPIGVNLTQDEHGRAVHDSVCIRCDRVDGFPCLVRGKADAQVICVDPALEHDGVHLVTDAHVRRLETDPGGRTVTTVVAELGDGSTARFSADIVVVSGGAVNSAVLLLASANDRHPNGLANGSGVVGRHYMRHNNLALMAVSKDPNPTRFQKTLAVNDWYLGSEDFDYPLGGVQMLGKSDAEQVRANAPRWAGALSPEMPFEELAHHAVDFWLCGEDLPQPDNRVTLDREGGIHLALDEKNNVEGLKRLRMRLQSRLGDLGMHEKHLLHHSIYMHKGMPIGATAHQAGTVRFGTDPESSALDVNCKAHELDNLYVVDTSFFPSIGAVNPSLTAIANALRVGDHLIDRLG